MPENSEPGQFALHFGFLEKDYGFQIQHTPEGFGSLYIASTENCILRVAIPNHPSGSPMVNIQPAGNAAQELIGKGYRPRSLHVAQIAQCFEPDLEQPEWWQSAIPKKTLPVMAEDVKKYCVKMLRGDFSEWPFLEKRMGEIFEERANEFRKNYRKCGYEIIEQDGKVGLTHNRVPVLKPIYSSIEITNTDSYEYTLEDYKDKPNISDVSEYNFPIVIADGNYGLLNGSEIRLGIDYQRIIKLTFCHYLCRKGDETYILYNVDNLSRPLATFSFRGELHLENLLKIMNSEYSEAYAELAKSLYKAGNKYISEYRRYGGADEIGGGYIHYFIVATIKVVIDNDFNVSPAV